MGYKNLATTAHSAPKVLYSHDIFSTQFVGGISRYIYELYIRNENAKIATLYSENLYLGKNKKRKDFRGKGRLVSYINELAEKLALAREKFDIYHLSYYKNLRKPKDSLLVISVYDMIHELYADSYFAKDTKTSKLKRLNCQQADGIIAISEQTKQDLIQLFGIAKEKIQVIYLGHSLRESHSTISLPDSYVLFVGGRSGYKNFENFVYAFDILHKKYPHLQALCVGAPFNAAESQLLAELNLDKNFTSIQAKENDLYTIYNKALCFVFPSFYEGFGIPILEAFFAKCASALSDIAVFREIADSSALYFDPHNPESIASTIETLLNNKDLKRTLIANATKRLELFSWDKTYQQTIDFYNSLLKGKNTLATTEKTVPKETCAKTQIIAPQVSPNIALILGAGGQDGYFLMHLLLEKGYEVHIMVRHLPNFKDIKFVHYDDLYYADSGGCVVYHYGDITDSSSIVSIFQKIKPSEIYNLAGISNVKKSFSMPQNTADSIALGTLRVLETMRSMGIQSRFYNACSSEIFGNAHGVQNEKTPFDPKSPYAIAKLYAFYMVRHYREAYGIFAVNGILFNHESHLRGDEFVSKKIIKAAVRIAHNLQDKLYLGNLDSKRDFGYAKDYVQCMYLMLTHTTPKDFVIATGEQHSIRELCEVAFRLVGITLEWQGGGIDEKGIDSKSKKVLVEVNPNYFRPLDVKSSIGDSTLAQKELGWNPKNTSFEKLIEIMVLAEEKEILKSPILATEGGGQYNVILYFGSYCANDFSHSTLPLKSQTTHSIFNLKKQEITNFSHIFAQDFSYYSRSYSHTLGGYMDKSRAA